MTEKAKFEEGKVVRVWKTTGCRELRGGPSTSERIDGEYPNISTDEDLTVTKRIGSTRAIVRRSKPGNGPVDIAIHINHIDGKSNYYALKAAGQTSDKQAKPTLEQAAAQLERAKKAYADAQKELATVASSKEVQSARDEAAALMAEADAELEATSALDEADREAADLAALEAELAGLDEGQPATA